MKSIYSFFFSALAATVMVLSGCSSGEGQNAEVDPSALSGTGSGVAGGDLSGFDSGSFDMGISEESMGNTIDTLESQATQATADGNTPLANAFSGGADFVGDLIGAYGQLQQQGPNLTQSIAQVLDTKFLDLQAEAMQLSTLFAQLNQQALADLFKRLALRQNVWAMVKPPSNGIPRKDGVAISLKEIMSFKAYGYRLTGGGFVSYTNQNLPFQTRKIIRCYDTARAMFVVTKAATCPGGSTGGTSLGFIATGQDGGVLPLKEMRRNNNTTPVKSSSVTTASSKQQKQLKQNGFQETLLGYVF